MKKKLLFALPIVLSLSALAQTTSQTTLAVEPMAQKPVFRVVVVSRSVQAVNYKHRSGASEAGFCGDGPYAPSPRPSQSGKQEGIYGNRSGICRSRETHVLRR